MWYLSKQFRFEAAHKLLNHDGQCARLHGHSWVGYVYLCGAELICGGAKEGMVMDFSDVKKYLKPLLDDYLDHYYLNDTLGMDTPTSENVARWVYEQLKPHLCNLVAVRIDETCTSSCVYAPGLKPGDFIGVASNAAVMG